jgi:tripartite-type tricarboxylate transporter receptor subunit TctC
MPLVLSHVQAGKLRAIGFAGERRKAPDVVEYLHKLGAEPRPMSIAEFTAFQKSESDRWGGLIKSIGLTMN